MVAGIYGIGAVTGYGWGREELWEGLLSGQSACTPSPGYRPGPDDPGYAAHVPDGGDPADGTSRFARAVRAAAREAIGDARSNGWVPGRRVGLLHATVLGEVDLWRDFYTVHDRKLSTRDYLALMPSTPMSLLMQEFGFRGPAMAVSAMCASGNAGMITAKAWIDAGIVDDVILIATDLSCTPESLDHFVGLGVAVTDTPPLQASRPFQAGSRGFVMGEASVAFVLSAAGGSAYAEVLGGAMTHDAYHVTSIEPGLTSVRSCFTDAIADAGIDAGDVRYLNAHGPGTRQCDAAEAAILESLFPPAAEVFSVKPLTGHCQGAASAVEIAVSALAYRRGVIPAPPAVAEAHPRLLTGLRKTEPGLTVKSSLGMGGHNSVIVLGPGQAP
ncbi:beta-ketoacyl synthase N-terminal-like domain-containing protein [Actinoplanes sp. NBRC 103695]|uniref:beta-ketoacyl synthase N-terminal-like domain-containing protein n=1 Tax=Actinoplanes sp. NBRC 103695 TaxID=3032202 RepID=UPI0024A4531F|nr:beta-ketoacyl synthase N-terminal-like domain-containing protein [Actinoplanes sp. NBRC 103695]GLY95403.1 3-oxoacyl-[acyl-carrier-protein] synthase 2 [Actinoplanes sp. NBRC 103695]